MSEKPRKIKEKQNARAEKQIYQGKKNALFEGLQREA